MLCIHMQIHIKYMLYFIPIIEGKPFVLEVLDINSPSYQCVISELVSRCDAPPSTVKSK